MLGEPPVEDRGPVHYQVSITGRQAAWFVALVLVALGLAFFLGMKTGRAARQGPDAAGALAQASDFPVPTAAPETREEARKAPTAQPEADKTLGFDEKIKSEPLPTPTAKPTPPPTPSPVVEPKGGKTAKASAKKEGQMWVQLLATKSAQAADELAKRLKKEGFSSDVSAVPGKSGWFRVRVGPYSDRAKAEAAAKKIRQVDKAIKNAPLVTP